MTNHDNDADHSWVAQGARDSEGVCSYYDEWAARYDADLADWGYDAPTAAAAMLKEHVAPHMLDKGRVLDLGCGTGLTGKALRCAGFLQVDGVDISAESLALAEAAGVYDTLHRADLQTLPLPLPMDAYDALVCVGVLTYIEDLPAILREFVRLLKPGGVACFTQRSDHFETRDFDAMLAAMERDGLWRRRFVSEPRPYLPGNPDFAEATGVIYCVFERS